MCYSILVETDLTKLADEFGVKIDFDSFWSAYQARADGQKLMTIPRGIDDNFANYSTGIGQKIRDLTRTHLETEIKRHQEKVRTKQTEMEELEAKLGIKHTKTNQKKFETAKRVMKRAAKKALELQGPTTPMDHRIMPNSYGPLIVQEGGKQKIKLSRYRLRPKGSPKEIPDTYNMFNIRNETINERKIWKHLFGRNHGIVVMHGFYEWVTHPVSRRNTEIHFFPEDRKLMWTPALYDEWSSTDESQHIHSFAIVTRDPPTEIERLGHDRCPVFPKWHYFDDYLNTDNSIDKFETIFHDLKPIEYHHLWVA